MQTYVTGTLMNKKTYIFSLSTGSFDPVIATRIYLFIADSVLSVSVSVVSCD